MCCYDCCYTSVFSISILLNLGCGLYASATAAYFSDSGNFWGFIIFGLYAPFSAWLAYYALKQMFFMKDNDNEDVLESLNWISGMATVITCLTLAAVYLLLTKPNSEPVLVAIFIAVTILIVLTCVTFCFMNFLRWGGESGLSEQSIDCEKCLVFSGVACIGS